MATNTYQVLGMTCDHCVQSVRSEVSAVPGVTDVRVELATGLLSVTGDAVEAARIRDAVAEAGYELRDPA